MAKLPPDTMLAITLSATISRRRYDDPDDVIRELRELAGHCTDLIAQEAGRWAGFHDGDPDMQRMVDALKVLPGTTDSFALGKQRRGAPNHGTHDLPRPRLV